MPIGFDPAKRDATLRDRGIDMARADEVFSGDTLTAEDTRIAYGETRYVTIGFLDGRMVAVAWTRRGRVRRIISMRKTNASEQAIYGPRFQR